MRRAALLGDGWMPYLFSPATTPRPCRRAAGCRRGGRDLDGFDWYAFIHVNVDDDDGDRARAAAAQTLGGSYRQDFDTMLDKVAAAGTPAEVLAKLRAFVDAGARHFVFLPAVGATGDPDLLARRIVDEIVPPLRDHAASRGKASPSHA